MLTKASPSLDSIGDADFNEVFFDDVHVPAENLVGELNGSWQAATAPSAASRP